MFVVGWLNPLRHVMVVSCVYYTFAGSIYLGWIGWIICCTMASLYTLDLSKYGDTCLGISRNVTPSSIEISLIVISDFNALLLLISLLLFFLEMASSKVLKSLFVCIITLSLFQFLIHIILFVFVNNVYWFGPQNTDKIHCNVDDFDEFDHIINTSYYYLLAGIIIISISVFIFCIFSVILMFYQDLNQYHILAINGNIGGDLNDIDDENDEYLSQTQQLIQNRRKQKKGEMRRSYINDNDEKYGDDDDSIASKQFIGKLDWNDYKQYYNKNELKQMINDNEFNPIKEKCYFFSIEINGKKVNNVNEYDTYNIEDKIPFLIVLNDNDNQQQNGYAIYDRESNLLYGTHRVLCATQDDYKELKRIRFKIGKEPTQMIKLNHKEDKITIDNEVFEWKRNKIKNCKEIKSSKICKISNDIKIYCEELIVYSSIRFPTEEECIELSTKSTLECKEMEFENGPNDMAILFEKERNMQIYYNLYENRVYGLSNKTANLSLTHFGEKKNFHKFNKQDLYFYNLEYFPYYFQNITQPFFMCSRYVFLRDIVLYGQDNEFNIFRSLVFLSNIKEKRETQIWARLSIAILVVILQILLTWAIVKVVVTQWDLEEMFDGDYMIIAISFCTFALLGYAYWFTISKFYKFYECLWYITKVSYITFTLDFISNILLGLVVVVSAFAYLLLSESISEVVLNSFALVFVIELDDIANLFESDEDFLLELDWDNCLLTKEQYEQEIDGMETYARDWNGDIIKRDVDLKMTKVLWKVIVSVILSPTFMVWAFFKMIHGIYYNIMLRKNNMDWTKYTRYQPEGQPYFTSKEVNELDNNYARRKKKY